MNHTSNLRSGLAPSLPSQHARRRVGQALIWAAALGLVLIVGHMSMEDEMVAEQMRLELEAAVITANAQPRCEPLPYRKANAEAQMARQCRTGDSHEK